MSEFKSNMPIPEEPDFLIQDLEDVPAPHVDEDPIDNTTTGSVCDRCGHPVPYGESYCADCASQMGAYPIRPLAWIVGAVGIVVFFVSLFLLATNVLIARPILRGDEAVKNGDLRGCYEAYQASYDIAAGMNKLIAPNASLTFYTNGSRTLSKQILAMSRLNGPYKAGQSIDNFYGGKPPKMLEGVYAEYRSIIDYVEAVHQDVTDYRESLEAGETGDYDKMVSIVEDCAKRFPQTPDYMVQYYRFSVSYSAGDDTARTASLLDTLAETAPDALWLYASEGIRAYDLDGQYDKALQLCNRLMKLDASNTATIAYTMAQMRLLRQFDSALQVYDTAVNVQQVTPSSEMERQRAIVLMLQGKADAALESLVDSYNPETAGLEHVATLCVCAYLCEDTELYAEYKALLDSYMPFRQVDALAAGDITIEDIFLTGGGEIQ